MTSTPWRLRFWWQWIAANSLAELLGLGGVALAGWGVVRWLGEPVGWAPSLAFAGLFVLLGAFEGLVVGAMQARVLRQRLPGLTGWVRASVIGALAAWALGMVPSTVMSAGAPAASGASPEMGEALRLLLAAGLGLVAGPVLALFQWRCLRRRLGRAARWWLPANGAAWALGMPLVFAGAHLGASSDAPWQIALGVGLSLLAAGAVVGAVHGLALVWLLSFEIRSEHL